MLSWRPQRRFRIQKVLTNLICIKRVWGKGAQSLKKCIPKTTRRPPPLGNYIAYSFQNKPEIKCSLGSGVMRWWLKRRRSYQGGYQGHQKKRRKWMTGLTVAEELFFQDHIKFHVRGVGVLQTCSFLLADKWMNSFLALLLVF